MTVRDPYLFLFTRNSDAPKKTTVYDDSLCSDFLEMRKQGFSLTECAGCFGVSRSTLNKWKEQHPKFKEAWEVAETYHDSWWLAIGRDALVTRDKDFDTRLWFTNMKNRMGWADSYSQRTTIEGNVTTNIAEQIAAANAKREATQDNDD